MIKKFAEWLSEDMENQVMANAVSGNQSGEEIMANDLVGRSPMGNADYNKAPEKEETPDFEYRGYFVNLMKGKGDMINNYTVRILKDGNYEYGIKGWLPKERAESEAKAIIDMLIQKNTK